MLYIYFAILSHLYYVYPLFFGFPSHLCHHQVLRRIVCAISKFSYLFYTQCIYVSLNLPIHLTCVCVCVCVCARARARLYSVGAMDFSPQGCSVHGIFQARVPTWLDICFSRGSSNPGIKPILGLPRWQADS